MEVLLLNKKFFQFMGYVEPNLIPYVSTMVPNVLFTLFSLILLYGNTMYMIANSENVGKITGAVYVWVNVPTNSSK